LFLLLLTSLFLSQFYLIVAAVVAAAAVAALVAFVALILVAPTTVALAAFIVTLTVVATVFLAVDVTLGIWLLHTLATGGGPSSPSSLGEGSIMAFVVIVLVAPALPSLP